MRQLRVVVLYNLDFELVADSADSGQRAGRDVIHAATQVVGALRRRGAEVNMVPARGRDVGRVLLRLRRSKPDLVFNLCESLHEDARHEMVMPALLELLDVPYTGSGPLALGLALHKPMAKELLRARGVPTPASCAVSPGERLLPERLGLRFPLIVKPAREDASVGICSESVVFDSASLRARVAHVHALHRQPALVEEYVAGREIYVSLLGNDVPRPLPFYEIDFSQMPDDRPRIVSYQAKWDEQSVEFRGTMPVACRPLDEPTRERIVQASIGAFAALDCRDYARVDIRLRDDGVPYVIDVNPNCDVSDGAGFSRAAKAAGMSYDELCERICRLALARAAEAARSNRQVEGPALRERALESALARTSADRSQPCSQPEFV